MFELQFPQAAVKSLKKAPREAALRIRKKLGELKLDPFKASNAKKLTDHPGYRLRVGEWRVLYLVRKEVVVVLVIDVGHRREIYR